MIMLRNRKLRLQGRKCFSAGMTATGYKCTFASQQPKGLMITKTPGNLCCPMRFSKLNSCFQAHLQEQEILARIINVFRNAQFGTSPFDLLKETQKQGMLSELSSLHSPPPAIYLLQLQPLEAEKQNKTITRIYIPVTSFPQFLDSFKRLKITCVILV